MAASMGFLPGGAEDDFDDDGFVFGSDNIKGNSEDAYKNLFAPMPANADRTGFGLPAKSKKKEKVNSTKQQEPKQPKQRSLTLDDFKMAVIRGNTEAITEFLNNGISVDSVLKCGWTGLMYAASCANISVVNFLLEQGADANFHSDMYTVLMAACSSTVNKEGDVLSCVSNILTHGANPSSHDRYHMTPLMYASREGRPGVVKKLLDCKIDINKQDSRGWTALTWSVFRSQKEVIKTLLAAGANPKLKHCDGQTAIDQANMQGDDEIMAIIGGESSSQSVLPVVKQPVNGQLEMAVPNLNLSTVQTGREQTMTDGDQGYVKYGELELFLCGLQLGNLVYKFQEQHVDFATFLRMTDEDFIKMGIQQIGIRKKILDGIQAVHKKQWEKASLPSILYNKHISCAEAVAMVANISKHSKYIGSSIGFVREQLVAHPTILDNTQEGAGPKQLHQHTVDTIKNVQCLQGELGQIQQHLAQILKHRNFDPPDLVKKSKVRKKRINYWKVCSLGLTLTVCVCIWKKTIIVNKITDFLQDQ